MRESDVKVDEFATGRAQSPFMPSRIEDYGLIGDTRTAALVGKDGSIDWLCFPRFDSGACFAVLLGDAGNGRWILAPAGAARKVGRRYRDGSLILETEFETNEGAARVIDFMTIGTKNANVVRMVEGLRGRVQMNMELVIRFDYGSVVPWVQREKHGLSAVAGPAALRLWTEVPVRGKNFTSVAEFRVSKGDRIPFVMTFHSSNRPAPRAIDPEKALKETEGFWHEWSSRCTYRGPWVEAVKRSLITLKALTYSPTGGIVAAPTTSLPEEIGGARNWDYRFCWLRDATFTLYSLITSGYAREARDWRDWLLRAVAGKPSELQIVYGAAGERRLIEYEVPWLAGYEGSAPVRVGNAASEQLQLDVYGEVVDLAHVAAGLGARSLRRGKEMVRGIIEFLESDWDKPDEGIWEVRGGRRHFTHSKVMVWVAMDRAVKGARRWGNRAQLDRWRNVRDSVRDQVLTKGFDADLGSFVQSFGSKRLDASLLMIPLVGFLPPRDPRVLSTIEAIKQELVVDGFVRRYTPDSQVEGVPGGEGVFLPCTFWLADALALAGETEEARSIFERLLGLRNDLGLLSEEYDTKGKRLLGNFPQAFTHVGLINTAQNLSERGGPAGHRSANGG
ncbi:MAG: glycoside hydrolase family 15 protein [Actinomycetota bacterium]